MTDKEIPVPRSSPDKADTAPPAPRTRPLPIPMPLPDDARRQNELTQPDDSKRPVRKGAG